MPATGILLIVPSTTIFGGLDSCTSVVRAQLAQTVADASSRLRALQLEELCVQAAARDQLLVRAGFVLPAVVQHLQVLEASGLVRSEKVGRVRTCTMEPEALQRVETWVNERRTLWARRLDRLGAYLAMSIEDAGEPADGNTKPQE